mgnify:CR=1 FL=1
MYAPRKIGGREATLRTKQYFEETFGSFGVLSFDIKSVKFDDGKSLWEVLCSFQRGLSGLEASYQVTLRDDGGIDSVTLLENAVQ